MLILVLDIVSESCLKYSVHKIVIGSCFQIKWSLTHQFVDSLNEFGDVLVEHVHVACNNAFRETLRDKLAVSPPNGTCLIIVLKLFNNLNKIALN